MFKTLYSQLVLTIFLMFSLLAAGLVFTLQYNHKINQDSACTSYAEALKNFVCQQIESRRQLPA